jgi:hypothetical protein
MGLSIAYEWGKSQIEPIPDKMRPPEREVLLRENQALQVNVMRAVQPEPETFEPWAELRVILKLANIKVVPEKPEYAGRALHVEG